MTVSAAGAGSRLGRYHLAEPMGGGPTGEVFRAKVYGVAGFERQFAVKRFHHEFVRDPDVAARVAAAARAYGSLEHPRVARLHEFGVAGGETFTAVELIEGVDLSRLIEATHGIGQPLPIGAAAALISQAGRAIGYAHGRGHGHFGVAPTNLLCTGDGEVKVTDFGFLPPRLPARAADDRTLAARIPYLAPEQLVDDPVSPATDVFQLGVIAYELLTGSRPFDAIDSFEVAQKILSAQPPEPPELPRQLLKVLRRCLARSPYERYPDAGAMADAIDAAVRSAPVHGDSRDVATVVRHTLRRMAEINEGQASGAMRFPMPAPPVSRPEDSGTRSTRGAIGVPSGLLPPSTGLTPRPSPIRFDSEDAATRPSFSAPPLMPLDPPPVPPHSAMSLPVSPPGPAAVTQDLRLDLPAPKPLPRGIPTPAPLPTQLGRQTRASIAGNRSSPPLPPPPSPAAPIESSPPPPPLAAPIESSPPPPPPSMRSSEPPPPPPLPGGPTTLRGQVRVPVSPGSATPPPVPIVIEAAPPPLPLNRTLIGRPGSPRVPHPPVPPPPGTPQRGLVGVGAPPTKQSTRPPTDGQTDDSVPLISISELAPLPPNGRSGPNAAIEDAAAAIREMDFDDRTETSPSPPYRLEGGMSDAVTVQRFQTVADAAGIRAQEAQAGPSATQIVKPFKRRRSPLRWVLVFLLFAGLGLGGFYGYTMYVESPSTAQPQTKPSTAKTAKAEKPTKAPPKPAVAGKSGEVPAARASGTQDAAPVAAEAKAPTEPPIDAAAEAKAAPVDAGAVAATAPTPAPVPTPGDAPAAGGLEVISTPDRAKVYVDGTLVGKTPLKLDSTADQHKLAVIKPGYKLHTASIAGKGKVDVALQEVTPTEGRAGIKVRCKAKDRYYVFVDGHDVGQLCPTERIGVEMGPHTVEIYDPVTDSRREFRVEVKQTRLSLRVRVD